MERPILFSTPMVQAILEGRKTQTRRIVKPQPDDRGLRTTNVPFEDWHGREIKCRYGKTGDLLWVRETWARSANVRPKISEPFIYRADRGDDGGVKWSSTWKPSIHMPKEAARIWLEVTDIRAERLQDITEEDAKAEGVEIIKVCNLSDPNDKIRYRDYRYSDRYAPNARLWVTAKRSFETLWKKINGQESYFQNPWVWVVSFKVLSTTGKPIEITNKALA